MDLTVAGMLCKNSYLEAGALPNVPSAPYNCSCFFVGFFNV